MNANHTFLGPVLYAHKKNVTLNNQRQNDVRYDTLYQLQQFIL